MAKIKSANATYTGGGIYQYDGQFENGNYFLCFTDWEPCMLELDADPGPDGSIEVSGDPQWQEEHTVRQLPTMESFKTLRSAFEWILQNKPAGNYTSGDIEDARKELDTIMDDIGSGKKELSEIY